MKIELSIVIITFNEERNLARCLESVKDIADEIIVLDSYSTDDTEKIARSFNAKFHQHKFDGHIEQKNRALDLAKHDYVLSLDADEELSKELKKNILEVKDNCLHIGYYFNRLSSYIDEFVPHGSWYPDKKLRLFNKIYGRWGGKNPHDEVVLLSDDTAFLKGNLNHYTYYSISQHVQKIDYFSSISAKEAYKWGNKFRVTDLLLRPFWRFFRDYFIKHGFLGGFRGLTISVLSSVETFLKIIKLWELERSKREVKDQNYKGKIIHICAENTWRGGEQQLAYLIQESQSHSYNNIVICKKGSAFERYCLFNDIPYRSLGMANSIDLISAYRISQICKKEKADILHMHSSKAHSLGAFSSLFGNNIKMVVTRRVMFDIKNASLSLWKYNLKQVKKVIAISRAIHNHLLSYGIKEEKLVTIYSGISLEFSTDTDIDIKAVYNIPDDYCVIGNVSALTEEKDIFSFLKVAKNVISSDSKVRFIVFGSGALENELKKVVEEYQIQEYVIFGGFITNVRSIISQFDIFLFTSKKEGLGTSVLDAMVAGVPTVSTNSGGLKETITHKEDGYLTDSGDVASITKYVQKLLNNPDLRKEMGLKAQQNVKRFDIHSMGNEVSNLYQNLLSEK